MNWLLAWLLLVLFPVPSLGSLSDAYGKAAQEVGDASGNQPPAPGAEPENSEISDEPGKSGSPGTRSPAKSGLRFKLFGREWQIGASEDDGLSLGTELSNRNFELRRKQGMLGWCGFGQQISFEKKKSDISVSGKIKIGKVGVEGGYKNGKPSVGVSVQGKNSAGVKLEPGGFAVNARSDDGWVHYNSKSGVTVSANVPGATVRVADRTSGSKVSVGTRGDFPVKGKVELPLPSIK